MTSCDYFFRISNFFTQHNSFCLSIFMTKHRKYAVFSFFSLKERQNNVEFLSSILYYSTFFSQLISVRNNNFEIHFIIYSIQFIITLIIISFSSGLDSAIIIVNATKVASSIFFSPFTNKASFLSRKYRNIVAAIRLFPSRKL